MEEGDYAAAEQLFYSARATVPTGSLWRLQLTWNILVCRRHLHDAPTREDYVLCQDAIATGEMLSLFGHADEPAVQRYLGLAYHLMGDYPAATKCLEVALRSAEDGGTEVAVALADCYRRTGRADEARRVAAGSGLPPH